MICLIKLSPNDNNDSDLKLTGCRALRQQRVGMKCPIIGTHKGSDHNLYFNYFNLTSVTIEKSFKVRKLFIYKI